MTDITELTSVQKTQTFTVYPGSLPTHLTMNCANWLLKLSNTLIKSLRLWRRRSSVSRNSSLIYLNGQTANTMVLPTTT